MNRPDKIIIPKKEPKKVSFLPELEHLEELESAFADRPGTPIVEKRKSKLKKRVSG